MEQRFAHDFSRVRIHTDAKAAKSAEAVNALAYTAGQDVVGAGRYAPGTASGDHLLAHELTHTLQNLETPSSQGIQRKPAADGHDSKQTYPWIGKITGTWAVALRSSAQKDAADPHRNTRSDLPRGTEVQVINRQGGWLLVHVRINGVETSGYVSQELVQYVRASAFELPDVEVKVKVPTVADAFVILKRAETQRAASGAAFKPDEDQEADIGLAISVLERTKKYVVDRSTFVVRFVETADKRATIDTIEDFILFVEQVERQYPSAKPGEVASEVRQLWFSDQNWEMLVGSRGITEGGSDVDIETQPNPIAKRFDMLKLAPEKGSKTLSTAMGAVDIGHVMAGIDAALSGFPAEFPMAYLYTRGHLDSDARLKYDTLKQASGGESRDFTTWAGDLGQAYAEFLVARFVKGEGSVRLASFVSSKAPSEELLGDIHGYITIEVWKNVPASASPTGTAFKISNVLRDLYLVGHQSAKQYRRHAETVSGTSDLSSAVLQRAKAFARPWFAKKAWEHKGFTQSEGWSAETILENWMKEFDRVDALHESRAANTQLLASVVEDFIAMLKP